MLVKMRIKLKLHEPKLEEDEDIDEEPLYMENETAQQPHMETLSLVLRRNGLRPRNNPPNSIRSNNRIFCMNIRNLETRRLLLIPNMQNPGRID